MNKLFHFFISVAVAQVLDDFGAIYYFCHNFLCIYDGGSDKFSIAKIYCVCESLVAGGFFVASMCTVVFRRCR